MVDQHGIFKYTITKEKSLYIGEIFHYLKREFGKLNL